MEITVQKGDFTTVEAEALVLFHFEQDERLLETTAAVNDAAGSIIGQVIEAGDFRVQRSHSPGSNSSISKNSQGSASAPGSPADSFGWRISS